MKHGFRLDLACLAAALALTVLTDPAFAQGYPAKSVRVIVPFEPGGGTDFLARIIGKMFYKNTGQMFVVENRSGADGLIGAELTARAPADGYTLLLTTISLAVNITLHKKIAFDPRKDLAPLSMVASYPYLLVVHPSVPAKSLKEFIDLTRKRAVNASSARAGTMNASSAGTGTIPHLILEIFKRRVGVDVMHVPYKGATPAILAVLTGEVDFLFVSPLSAQSQLKLGKLRALAITAAERSLIFPDLPTIASLYPGFDARGWYGMFLPAGVPNDITTKIHSEITKALKSPEVNELITKEGGTPIGSTPDEFAAYFRREVDKYAQVIKAGILKSE